MHLSDLWFIIIAVLWAGYFVLEGFDFGVGILLPILGPRGSEHSDTQRRVMINTVGSVWDGNEVWLITAGGATFAAFPAWYASMFSAFYLPLLLILIGLIIRGVAFEYRGKRDHARWRAGWDAAIFTGSLLAAILWGVAFGNILRGIPLNAEHNFTGNFFTFLNPYALLGGLTTLVLFVMHGALFLALKTTGDLRSRARRIATRVSLVTVVVAGAFLAWTGASHRAGTTTGEGIASVVLAALAAVALITAAVANRADRDGIAFGANMVAIAAATASLFTALYPNVLPSSTSPAYSLTTANAASTAKTLMVMTVVAVIFLPFVLAYQAWSYWVFRKRVTAPPQPAPEPPPRSGTGEGPAADPVPAAGQAPAANPVSAAGQAPAAGPPPPPPAPVPERAAKTTPRGW